MKLHAHISEYQTDIKFKDKGSVVLAEIDGRTYELEVRHTADGLLLSDHGAVFNCRLDDIPESGKTVDVLVGTRRYAVTLVDLRRLRSPGETGIHGDGAVRILAPMPGKVVRLLVNEGDGVEAGSGVLVVEAMKMQNEMKSPKKGMITTLKVTAGETVNAGDVLAIIE